MRTQRYAPFVVAIWYFFLASLWVLLSDRALETFVEDGSTLTLLQTAKGWFFVLGSTLLIAVLSIRQHRIRDDLENERHALDQKALREYRGLVERLVVLEQRIGTASGLDEVCRALKDFVAASAPLDGIFVARYHPEAHQRICAYAFSGGREEDTSELPPMPMNDSPSSRAILTGDVVVVEDDRLPSAEAGPRVDLGTDIDAPPPRSSVSVPMIIDGKPIGAFEVQSVEAGSYTQEHVAALRMAGSLAAMAMRNVELLQREREATRAVEASEARFRSLVQNSSDIVRLLDRDGTILYESPAVTRILGDEPSARASRNAFDRVHPDDARWLKQAFAQAIEVGRGEATYRVRHADGEWRWIESVGVNLFDDPNVRAFVLNSRDVTDRKQMEEALLEEKAFNEATINSLPGVFYVIRENGSYAQWNRNFEQVLGYSSEDVIHLRPNDVVEGNEESYAQNKVAEAFLEGATTAEANLVTKEGTRIPYFFTGEKFAMRDATYVLGIGIDKSEIDAARTHIQELNEELQERLERITSLHEIDQAITSSIDLDLTLDVVLEQVTKRLHVDAACILLYRPQGQTLRFGASKGFRSTTLRTVHLRMGQGLAGRAALQRERLFVGDPAAFAQEFRAAQEVAGEDFQSYLAVPLVAKGQLQGVLELFHRSPLDPSEDWYAFLTTLATQAAIALDNATMFEHLERSNAELRLAYDTTIEGWARALDLKDEETEGHSRRVTDLTVRLAEAMGTSEEELVHVRRGALLHDIGKMGIPDAILLKPGKLDPDEWEIMKQHTTYAFDLLAPIAFLRPALDIPYCHHERWDGSGYPRGLKGDRIPLAARLFSVVDVYDALTSDRPYRAAWREEKALDHIREGAGTHFDPAAVDAFLALMSEAT